VGILKSILLPLFEQRKNEADPLKKQAIKLIMVSIYGIVGSPYSPFYNVMCARAITSLGRKACETA
jgi:DNA polymerase elongation subunit (family B)